MQNTLNPVIEFWQISTVFERCYLEYRKAETRLWLRTKCRHVAGDNRKVFIPAPISQVGKVTSVFTFLDPIFPGFHSRVMSPAGNSREFSGGKRGKDGVVGERAFPKRL